MKHERTFFLVIRGLCAQVYMWKLSFQSMIDNEWEEQAWTSWPTLDHPEKSLEFVKEKQICHDSLLWLWSPGCKLSRQPSTLWIAAYKWSSGIIPLSCQSQVFSQHCFVHFLPPQVICTVLVIKERVGNWIPCLIINAIQNSKKLSWVLT